MSGLDKTWKSGFVKDLDVGLAVVQDFVVVDTPGSIQIVRIFSTGNCRCFHDAVPVFISYFHLDCRWLMRGGCVQGAV